MAVLSVGLIGSSAVLVKGFRTARDTITVTGASTERIRSDYADWSVLVSQGGDSQQQSYGALQPSVQQIRAFLLAHGLRPDELKLGSLSSDKEEFRDPRSGELRQIRWTSRQTILISSADVDKINRLAAEIPALIGLGVPLTINEPAYTYTKLAEKRVDMLAKATKDARDRAWAIAAQAQSSIGAITNADTGTFQITAPNSTEASNSGSYDTRTIAKDITAVMAVTFRVN
ncbi:MAG: SIMPL domain-containing protein [Cyanobacteria bacterium]|nr:SIMPL domain-containing protein [Cyanobacteriota bacterium]